MIFLSSGIFVQKLCVFDLFLNISQGYNRRRPEVEDSFSFAQSITGFVEGCRSTGSRSQCNDNKILAGDCEDRED